MYSNMTLQELRKFCRASCFCYFILFYFATKGGTAYGWPAKMGLVPFRQPSTLFCCCHLVLHIFCCIVENIVLWKINLSLSLNDRSTNDCQQGVLCKDTPDTPYQPNCEARSDRLGDNVPPKGDIDKPNGRSIVVTMRIGVVWI